MMGLWGRFLLLNLIFVLPTVHTAFGAEYYVAFEKGNLKKNIQTLPAEVKVLKTFAQLDLLLVSAPDKTQLPNTKFVNRRPTHWLSNVSEQNQASLSQTDFEIPWGVEAIAQGKRKW